MAKKQFKAESKRLLEMMINSIYTHKEIFLRELISNSSDALDKLYFKSLTENIGLSRGDFAIALSADKTHSTLTIADNGIGMDKEELENNLGVIAQSGSFKFKKDNADNKEVSVNEDISVIGQFGVGFYSAFMVAKKVEVRSKKYGSDEAFLWTSEGVDGFVVEPCEKDSYGTEITLYLKDNTDDENYDEFLAEYKIKSLIKKYSDYIRYPIKMECTHHVPVENHDEKHEDGCNCDECSHNDEPKYEDKLEIETLNSMVPLWKKNKSELKDEDYNSFYKEKFYDYTDPLAHIHSKVEGAATYNALLYIPKKAPYDYYTKEYEKGLQLYSSGVMIMEKCADLLPDHFSFVKGLVDSEDLSLNISREMLQHDRQLKVMAKSIERSIKNELEKMLTNEREKYEEFWKAFGLQIKFGIYNGFGANKDTLKDLLLFYSSTEKKLTTLTEYVTRMKEEQKFIYFASGESVARIDSLPQVELVKDKGFEILYLTDNVDEFALQMMADYNEKQFKSVQSADLDLETEEEKAEIKQKNEDNKDMFLVMKEALSGKVDDVKLSQRLKSHPVCLASTGAISMEMEKVLNSMPNAEAGGKPKANKVLEINPSHKIFEKLTALYENDKDKLKEYADILYNQALLIEGLPIENPADFAAKICDIMVD